MKKLKIILFMGVILLVMQMNMTKVNASAAQDYQSFSSMTLSSGKLLRYYTSEEVKNFKSKVGKRKFSGWRTYTVNNRVKCNFISETVFSVYNTGTTAIKYELSNVTSTVKKVSLSCTGSLSYSYKKDVKTFKDGLDATLKIEKTVSETIEVKTTEKFEISVDPKTRVTMYFAGTGYLTTGFAQSYFFWIKQAFGGYEYFTVADIYPRIEKVVTI